MKRHALLAAVLLATSSGAALAETYTIDPSHTQVRFTYSHLGLSNILGIFGGVTGTVVYDAAKPEASSVKASIPIGEVYTGWGKMDEHLKAAGFFDVATYPTATFTSTKVEAAGEGKLKVTGDLTIKGITKPVVLDVTLNKAGEHPMKKVPAIGFDATATVKRSDFGVGAYAPMVSDEVALKITTEATADAAK